MSAEKQLKASVHNFIQRILRRRTLFFLLRFFLLGVKDLLTGKVGADDHHVRTKDAVPSTMVAMVMGVDDVPHGLQRNLAYFIQQLASLDGIQSGINNQDSLAGD